MGGAFDIEAADAVAASHGDEAAFGRLVQSGRAELHAHCYRMLGSLHDADDALQETLLRAWRALPRFRGQSSLRTWLHRIATNVCLDAIARRPKRVLPIDYGPPRAAGDPEPDEPASSTAWIEPYPDETLGVADGAAAPEARYEHREALELAFIAALQHLSPRQRAALILRDVLGFSAKEAAQSLETSVASVNGALLLMPGGPPPRLRYLTTRANGQLALGTYQLDRAAGGHMAIALDVLTLRGGEIVAVTAFRMPEIFPRFGLPERLALS